MTPGTVDAVLREHEVRNERRLAAVRLGLIALFSAMDLGMHAGWIPTSSAMTSARTILLDALAVVYSGIILWLARRPGYRAWLKYLAIACDFGLAGAFLVLDPAVVASFQLPSGGLILLLFFVINLLRFSPAATLAAAGALAAVFAVTVVVFGASRDDTLPMVVVTLLAFLGIGYHLSASSRRLMAEAGRKQLLERYLAPELVAELGRAGASPAPGGQKQVVTLLFADVRGFTTLSERLEPDVLIRLLNRYLEAMTEVVFAHHGTLDKFLGDGMLVFFGAPVPRADAAAQAVATAVEMQRRLAELNRQGVLDPPLQIGVGIHTGEALVGNVGSARRLDYTVIGDAVNLASRVEGLTKHLGCGVLVTDATRQAAAAVAPDGPALRRVGAVVVKGRREPVTLHEVVDLPAGAAGDPARERIASFVRALTLFEARGFEPAAAAFRALPPEPLRDQYLARCERLIAEPPGAAWTAALEMHEK